MALKATVHKAELQVNDLDRHYYASHSLTLAQHPSETAARLMTRVAAFALFADAQLRFGKGISTDDEPDLWQHSLDGQIEHWIDLGQPDPARLRKACGRSRRVTVLGYQHRSFSQWWEKHAALLGQSANLQVLSLPEGVAEQLADFLARGMQLQAMISDGELQLSAGELSAIIAPIWLQR